MKFKYIFKTAVTGLRTHKSRSALTILGIVIGITAIIIVMALGQGAQNLILGQIQSIGSKIISVAPGRMPKGPSDFISMLTNSLKEKDLEALQKKSNVPHLSRIMPVVYGSETASYGSETHRPTIFGVTPLFSEIYSIDVDEGRIFTDEEVRSYADVVIIGAKVKDELFGANDAVGERIKIKGKNFRVIGILGNGQMMFMNFDEAAVVPYTTAQQYIFGIKHFNEIAMEVDSEENVDATIKDVESTIREAHNITDPEKDDFHIESTAQAMETVSIVTDVLKWFLASVAAISLVVGGVGIMNIMLVSVTERTREIGLRKAVGATEKNIMLQFLLESVTLTVAGGIIGIILGASISFLVSLVLSSALAVDWAFVFPVSAALLGIGVAAAVGLVFGLYPARQAAKKSPIEALRYE